MWSTTMKDKKTSKRGTLKQKYTIEKKSREHRRRLKKVAKTTDFKKRFQRKDPGIPNSWPFKTEMLEEIQKKKQAAMLEKQQERERLREEQRKSRMEKSAGHPQAVDEVPELVDAKAYEELAARAEASASQHNAVDMEDVDMKKGFNSTSGFIRSLRNVIEKSDVLIEVLDARDPNGCRNLDIERRITADGKKLILLLNKVDLVPKDVVESWVQYLRQFYPVLPFKAATLKSTRAISHTKVPHTALSKAELHVGSQVVGAPALITLLKNYARTGPSNTAKVAITVGIIGAPNVGKSSVINSLCRSLTAAKVGGEAGVTRHLQEINLDAKIKLIDCPGVVLESSESDPDVILRNSVKISTIKNAIEVVDVLCKKYPVHELMQLFKVPFFSSTNEFLGHIAKLRGKLCKGGAYDFEAAAHTVLFEWTSGKVVHYCLPPSPEEVAKADAEAVAAGLISGPRVVSHLAEPLNVDAL